MRLQKLTLGLCDKCAPWSEGTHQAEADSLIGKEVHWISWIHDKCFCELCRTFDSNLAWEAEAEVLVSGVAYTQWYEGRLYQVLRGIVWSVDATTVF